MNPLSVGLKEAAKMIGIAPRTLRKYAALRQIPSVKLGNRLLFRVADLEQFLKEHERPAVDHNRQNIVSPGEKARRALSQISEFRRGPVN
jgi:excisionase family DNA binding protein